MFGILDRYIGRVIFMSILLCELTLVGLAALIKYVEQLKADVRRLQRENDILRQEREILKKTVSIFSQER